MLSLTLGEYKKVTCYAEGYYPKDVNIEWLREHVGNSPSHVLLDNVLHTSHQHDRNGMFSLSAFFYLKPGLKDSGYKYTCKVSHISLLTPLRKSFILSVTGESDAIQTQTFCQTTFVVSQGFSRSVLEGLCPVEFTHNMPQHTCLENSVPCLCLVHSDECLEIR